MAVHPLAGKPAPRSLLVNVPRLVSAYYTRKPDVSDPGQRVVFGTSGHRGSSLKNSLNEDHILAISQAICEYRKSRGINGPLFVGMDTHALSEAALASALEVFAANEVTVMIQKGLGYTPTPVISHAILTYNRDKGGGFADGVVITPSHNPPQDGGFKYNPPDGGPADTGTTAAVEDRANEILRRELKNVKRVPFERALKANSTHEYDYIAPYVRDLKNVIDMEAIAKAGLKIGADPLGGSGIDFWDPIAEQYGLSIELVNRTVDPTFSFMTTDKDGIVMGLLAAEITARTGTDPAELYKELEENFGSPVYERIDAPATPEQKAALKKLSPEMVTAKELAGDPVIAKLTRAPGNNAPFGGLKVVTENGWFAARPSGTEDICKIYAESFEGKAHLQRIQEEAQAIVNAAFTELSHRKVSAR